MFEIDDEFDLDEVLLDSVLTVEKEAIASSSSETNCPAPSNESILSSVKYPLKRKSSDADLKAELPTRSSKDCLQLLESNVKSISQLDNTKNQAASVPSRQSKEAVPDVKTPKSCFERGVLNKGGTNGPGGMRTISGACQRKFPGPAGLLPERASRALYSSNLNESQNKETEPEVEVPLCSQPSQALDVGPWQVLRCDLREANDLLSKYTVAWVKQRAAARRLAGQKVPFLAAVLHSVDSSSPDPAIVLRDKTGLINGIVHRSVWECHGGQLVQGAALVLRQVGVLSTGSATQRHYVNVTSNNVVTIYAPSSDGDVKVTEVNVSDLKEIRIRVNEWEAKCKLEAAAAASTAPSAPPSLFSSTLQTRSPLRPIAPSPTLPKPAGFPVVKNPTPSSTSTQKPSPAFTASNNFRRTAPNAISNVASENQNTPMFKPKTALVGGALSAGSSVPVTNNRVDVNRTDATSTQISSGDADSIGLEVSGILDGLDTDLLFGDF